MDGVAAGRSVRAMAREHGVNPGTVSRMCQAAGIDVRAIQTERATAARRDYVQAERLEALNEAFDVVRARLPMVVDAHDVRHLVMALAVLIDKRRLEDGEVTDRTETNVNDASARERIAGRIDELAARRRARDDAERDSG